MNNAFLGTEALRQGKLTEYELRAGFRTVFPNIYLPIHATPTLRLRSEAAWLWSRWRGVIAGLAAAALHGADWIDQDEPVELIWRNQHAPAGILTRNYRVGPDEVTRIDGLPVTTLVRTAFDLARRPPPGNAIARLDALMRAERFSPDGVLLLAKRHAGTRGLRQLGMILPRVDAGAASPKETWLRLLLTDMGLPTPETQIPVLADYRIVAVLDMGWPQFKVAVEYDGDQHRTSRRQYVRDLRRLKALEKLGWIVIRVIAEDKRDDIISKVREALRQRGYRDI